MGRGTHWSMDDVQKMAHYVEDGAASGNPRSAPRVAGFEHSEAVPPLQQGLPPRKAGSGLGRWKGKVTEEKMDVARALVDERAGKVSAGSSQRNWA